MFYRKHPHVRGEDAGSGLSCQKTLETPPRAWGRRISPSVARSVCGNTPTCVGKTTMSIDAASKHQKHPHVRGEDDAQYEVVPEERETPPRAWGRLAFARKLGFKAGNTPTCVGKTLKTVRFLGFRKKHPHVRGEDARHAHGRKTAAETPPRAWGRRQKEELSVSRVGNTPTCVGKTINLLQGSRATEKHPHVRGEDSRAKALKSLPSETPPRAWGRPRRRCGYCDLQRNTPTCVGKTS